MNILGTTMHTWMGMGLMTRNIHEKYIPTTTYNTIQRTDIILIDEVSMVNPEFIAKFNQVCSICRNNPEPFGGIRVVFFGDFLQLPPICKDNNIQYLFQTHLWQRMNVGRLFLRYVYRQDDPQFISMLNLVRVGKIPPKTIEYIAKRFIRSNNDVSFDVIRLMARSKDVNNFNEDMLLRLDHPSVEIKGILATRGGRPDRFEQKTIEKVMKDPSKFFTFPTWVILKVGARVMARVNKLALRICNGSMGDYRCYQ